MRCPSCGYEMDSLDTACRKCGQGQRATAQAQSPAEGSQPAAMARLDVSCSLAWPTAGLEWWKEAMVYMVGGFVVTFFFLCLVYGSIYICCKPLMAVNDGPSKRLRWGHQTIAIPSGMVRVDLWVPVWLFKWWSGAPASKTLRVEPGSAKKLTYRAPTAGLVGTDGTLV